jgi:K+-sensing histidine kinase KdpD
MNANLSLQLHKSAARVRPRIEHRGVRVMVDARADLVVHADTDLLADVLDRLLEHCARSAETPSSLVVLARAEERGIVIEWRGLGEERTLGRPRPFAWEAASREPTALGLTLARGRAQTAGWKITAHDERASTGSAFTVKLLLPATDPSQRPA